MRYEENATSSCPYSRGCKHKYSRIWIDAGFSAIQGRMCTFLKEGDVAVGEARPLANVRPVEDEEF